MLLRQVVAFGFVLGLTSLAHAASLSYTFITTGGDPEDAGSAATGTGALTVDAVPGAGSSVTAFTYTLTESFSGQDATQATFGLEDITGFGSTVGGTAATPVIDSFNLTGADANGGYFQLQFPPPPPARYTGPPLALDAYYSRCRRGSRGVGGNGGVHARDGGEHGRHAGALQPCPAGDRSAWAGMAAAPAFGAGLLKVQTACPA